MVKMKLLKRIGILFITVFSLSIAGKHSIVSASEGDGVYYLGQTSTAYDGESTMVIPSDSVIDEVVKSYTYQQSYDGVTKVIFNEGVTKTDRIISRFPNVKEVQLPATLTNYGSVNSKSLEKITVSEENSKYKTVDGVLYFDDWGVTRIACYPSDKQDSVYEVPENVSLVYASISNAYVKKLIIGNNAVNDQCLSVAVKKQFKNLEKIEFTEENTQFISKDGVVFDKSGKCLIAFPAKGKADYTVPTGTTEIGEDAFYKTDINKVTLPTTVKTIRWHAFYQSSLKNIIMPKNGLTTIRTAAFEESALESVKLPEGLVSIGAYSFWKTPLRKVTIASTVKNISYSAFKDTKLTGVTLPKSLKSIKDSAFDLEKITTLKLASGNKYFSMHDGVLYNKAKTKLIWWPYSKKVKTLKFASTLKEVDIKHVCAASSASSIIIPKAMKTFLNPQFNTFKTVQIAAGNKNFCVKKNIVYSKNMVLLELYPLKSTVKNVELANGLVYLDLDVFGHAKNNIVTLTLPKQLRQINSGFGEKSKIADGFVKLTTIKVNSANRYFKSVNGILYNKKMTALYWFPINKNVTKYTTPATVTTVKNGTLVKQNYLKVITFSEKCNKMYEKLEATDEELEDEYKLFIGMNCPKIEAIHIKNKNSKFYSNDGVVYTKEGTLVCYPCQKKNYTFTLPEKASEIACVMRNPYLKELVLNTTIKAHDCENAFTGLTALETITVPSENKHMKSIDGVLYSISVKDNVEQLYMWWYPIAKKDTTLKLPANFQSICVPCAEYLTKYVTAIELDESNTDFYIQDNALYRKDGVLILQL